MTDIQENKLTMYEALVAFLWANIAIWEGIPAFSDISKKVKSNVTAIHNLGQIQAKDEKGLTTQKLNLEKDLGEAVIKIVNALIAYATINNDPVLLQEVKITQNGLDKLRDELLYEKALFIHQKAAPLEIDLAALMITPEDIANVATLAESFHEALPAKRNADVLRKGATADMDAKFKEQDAEIAKLDAIVPIFESSNPEFVQGYWNARIIIDLGKRYSDKTLITGHVTDAANQLPLTNAYVWIVETGTSYNTNDEGYFSIDVKEAGNYTVQVQKQGYQTFTHDTIHLNTGNRVSLDIELEPEVK